MKSRAGNSAAFSLQQRRKQNAFPSPACGGRCPKGGWGALWQWLLLLLGLLPLLWHLQLPQSPTEAAFPSPACGGRCPKGGWGGAFAFAFAFAVVCASTAFPGKETTRQSQKLPSPQPLSRKRERGPHSCAPAIPAFLRFSASALPHSRIPKSSHQLKSAPS